MTYFQTFHHYVHAHKILSSENFYWKSDGSFKMLTIYYSFWQLWAIFALVFKLPIIMCTLANFCHLKIFTKNGGSFKMLTIYYSFRQLWAIFVTKLMKRSTIFFNILKLPLYFYMFTKFHDQQIKKKKKKKPSVSICEQNLAYCSNFEQYFPQKLWKTLQFL